MALKGIIKGKIARPVSVLMHGTEGVGKSTFAADSPSPIFICTEDGTARLDVQRFPEPTSWEDILGDIDQLINEEHDRKTVVIDTLDWLEPLCWKYVVAHASPLKSGKRATCIEDVKGGYFQGHNIAAMEWRVLLARLEELQKKRAMNVVLVAHSWIKNFSNPEGENFDRYELKLDKRASGVVREWCEAVLFASWEQATHEDGSKSKGISTGARIMRTEWRATFDAKNRFGLPFEMALSWEDFWSAVQKGEPESRENVKAEIRRLALGTAYQEKAEKRIALANDDVTELCKAQNQLRATLAKETANAA